MAFFTIVATSVFATSPVSGQQGQFDLAPWYVGISVGTGIDASASYSEVVVHEARKAANDAFSERGSHWTYGARLPAGTITTVHVGRHFNWLRLELSVERSHMEYDNATMTLDSHGFPLWIRVGNLGKTSATHAILGASFVRNVGQMQGSVGAGFGVAKATSTNPLFDYSDLCMPGSICSGDAAVGWRRDNTKFSDTVMSVQVSVGVNCRVGRNLGLGLELIHRWVGDVKGNAFYEDRADVDFAEMVVRGVRKTSARLRWVYMFGL